MANREKSALEKYMEEQKAKGKLLSTSNKNEGENTFDYLDRKTSEKQSALLDYMDSLKESGKLLSSADMNEGEDSFAYLDRKIKERKERDERDRRYESAKKNIDENRAAQTVKAVEYGHTLPTAKAADKFTGKIPVGDANTVAQHIAQTDLDAYRERKAELESARPSAEVQAEIDEFDGYISKAKKDKIASEFGLLVGNENLYEQANERLDWLKGEQDKLKDELEESRYAEYELLKENDDFREKSQYKSTANAVNHRGVPTQSGVFGGVTGYDDWVYEYINKNPAVIKEKRESESKLGGAAAMGYDLGFLSGMTEDEVGTYNYLYAKEGKERADKYLEFLQSDLYARQRETESERYADLAKEHPALASAASVAMNTAKGAAYVGQALDRLITGEADPNAPYNAPVYNTNAIRNTVAQQVEAKWGAVGSFGYQTAMSMADFLVAAGLSGGTGVSLLIMGSGAAADTTLSALDRGVDSDAALALGAVAGFAEAFTEKVSLEALLKGDWTKKTLGYIIKNTMAEGSEEALSALINTVADVLISGDKSEWEMSIRAYMDEGLSDKEAFKNTFLDKMKELGLDALGGAISGMLMSSVNSVPRAVLNKAGETAAKADRKYTEFETLRSAVKEDAVNRESNEFVTDKNETGIMLPTAEEAGTGEFKSGLEEDTQIRAKTYEETVLDRKIAQAETAAEKSGLKLGVKGADIKVAADLSKAIDRDVAFYSDASENGKKHEAYFDPDTGRIMVNKDADTKKKVSQILGHELTHTVERTSAYEDLASLAFESLLRDGVDFKAERAKIRELWERAGVELRNDEQIDAEIVARYVEKKLLNNKKAIRELIRDNPSLARQFKNKIDRTVMKLAGTENLMDMKTLAAVQDLQKIYADAASEVEEERVQSEEAVTVESVPAVISSGTEETKPVVEGTVHATQANEGAAKETVGQKENVSDALTDVSRDKLPDDVYEYIRNLEDRLEAGEITEEEFDEALAVVEEVRETGVSFDKASVKVEDVEGKIPTAVKKVLGGIKPKTAAGEGGVKQYSVAGETSENADRDSLQKAKHMEKYGEDSESIRKETGWYRGYDGEWRYEINDAKFKILIDENTPNYLTLGELIDHPKLFEAYPQLRDVDVVFQNLEGSNARYNAQFDDISIDRSLKNDSVQLKSSLIHEIQHAIQNIEGFSPGASPAYWERQLKNGFDSRRELQKQETARLWKKFNDVRQEDPGFTSDIDELISITPNVPRGEINWDTLEQIEEDPPEWKAYDALRDRLAEKYGEARVFDYINMAHKIRGMESNGRRNSIELYYETAGEIEARDTAARVDFDKSQRENIRPDIDRKDVVFAGGNKISNDIVVLENGNTYVKASRKIITGQTLSEQRKQITQFFNSLLENTDHLDVHTLQGDVITITKSETANKARDNYKTVNGKKVRLSDNEFRVKLNAEAHIDEIAEVSIPYSLDSDNKDHEFAKDGFSYRSAYFEDLDGQYYKLDISVGQNGTVATIYNIGKIKGSKPSSAKIIAAVGSKTLDGMLPEYSISRGSEDVNSPMQYSASEEEPKRLSAFLPTNAMTRLRKAEDAFARTLAQTFVDKDTGARDDVFTKAVSKDLRDMATEYINYGTAADAALDELFRNYNTAESPEAEAWQFGAFDRAAKDFQRELDIVKRYSEKTFKTDTAEAPKREYSNEEIAKLYEDQRNTKRMLDRVMARVLLSDEDSIVVGQILRGETSLGALNPSEYNIEDIKAAVEAKRAVIEADKQVKLYQKQVKAGYFREAEKALANIGTWKDKTSPMLYYRETVERNFRDIISDKEESTKFISQYVKPVHRSEANRQRMLESYRQRVRDLNLSEKPAKGETVSESYAVQLLGEAEDNIRILEKLKNPNAKRDGRTLKEWRSVVETMWLENPSLNEAKIPEGVQRFQKIYDGLIGQMNDVLLRNGYAPVRYRSGYFPHFTAGSEDSVLARFSRLMGINLEINPLPTAINGLTQDFKPGKPWFSHSLERTGFETAYDAVAGFEQYIKGVSDVIYHTENIQRFRALVTQIRWLSADEGIRKQHEDILNNETLTEEEKQNLINELYEKARFRMSNLAVYVDEYANRLANKKSRMDRSVEGQFGRKIYTIMKNVESRVASNMIGLNIGSAMTNIIPLNQAQAIIGPVWTARGVWDTMQSAKKNDGLAAMSDFLTNRRGSDPLGMTFTDKLSKVSGKPMEWIDNFVSESIVRAAYLKNLKSGMSEDIALEEADALAASIIADRSKGAQPLIFDISNPVTKLFTQFQVEVNNEFSVIFKDMPEEFKEKGLAILAGKILQYFFGAKLFNDIYEKLFGRRPALDPIEMVNDAVGGLTGYQLPNVLDIFEPEAWKTERKGAYESVSTLAQTAFKSLPFAGGVFGEGRIPIQSAIPDLNEMWKAVSKDDMSLKNRADTFISEALKPAAYLVPPTGGGMLKKVIGTGVAAIRGGVYGVQDKTLDDGTVIGEDKLKYPIYTDSAVEAAVNFARSLMGGTSTTTGGVEWVESGFRGYSVAETSAYEAVIDLGVKQHTATDLIKELRTAAKDEENGITQRAVQAEMILSSGMPDEAQAVMYYTLSATQSDQKLIESADAAGADATGTALALMRMAGIRNDVLSKDAEMCDVIRASDLDDRTAKMLYAAKVNDKDGDSIDQAELAGVSFSEYMAARAEYERIKEKYEDPLTRTAEFEKFVDKNFRNASKNAAIQSIFEYSASRTSVKNYKAFTEAGIGEEHAYNIAAAVDALKPLPGAKSVTAVQKARAVIESAFDDDERDAALSVVLSASDYSKYRTAGSFGINADVYVSFRESLSRYNADGNGSFKNEEVTAAINAMSGNMAPEKMLSILLGGGTVPESVNLTNAQKAVLWQLTTGSTSAKNNPYSTSTGNTVLKMLGKAE